VLGSRQEAKSHHSANCYRRRNRPEYPESCHNGDELDNAHGLNALSALVAEGSRPSWSFRRMLSTQQHPTSAIAMPAATPPEAG